MATSVAKYFLLSRCSGIIRSVTLQGKLPPVCIRNRNLLGQCPSFSYGNRASDNNPQDGHVNIPVVSTKAEVRFHVCTADWIPEDVRQKIILNNKNRINKAGELLVTSEQSRSQQRNMGDCIQKISDIIAKATEKPHEPSAEDIALKASRLEKRNKERLKQKKLHSAVKQTRRVNFD
ncbi:peptidyl-tRNA hydrolase ICT1, mitochondrial isoform X2 [Salvelinus namaycush]|uniref:Peptidyl-tRNA hydrolase ICT1, mitochondrial isoform X2 n=1 Tax=Salvelinus namaycush TaxID=8040 RepID=A0A8U0PVH9_SALNM|nr:peptidyl-tRNA hydrolase ICT1, mitochondrial isoform X2 [Salvelinus namaycush]